VSQPSEDDEDAAFLFLLDQIERELAEYTEEDHRIALDRILRDANQLVEEGPTGSPAPVAED
jgi:hypothetical protein